MACGLEVRPPLLDHELLELTARIPSGLKVRRGETKWLMKEAFRDRLPAETLRRPKQGFEIPLDLWLAGPLREQFDAAVLAPQAPVRDLVSRAVVRSVYRAHQSGAGRHGAVLWSLLVLARWCERYLAAPSPLPGGDPVGTA
jgi:asparagine synthase (glutamine-hydrolysing)